MKKGYNNIYWFKGGIPEWRRFNYPLLVDKKYQKYQPIKMPPQKVQAFIDGEDIFVLDVRPRNFTKGPKFIVGSHHVPLIDIINRMAMFPKDKPIIVSDWAMRQSPLAAKYLMANGFDNVVGLVKGGIERWVHDGLPTEERAVEG